MTRWVRCRRGAGLVVVGVVVAAGIMFVTSIGAAADSKSRGGYVGPDLHSLVVSPSDPTRLFVGGHEAVATSGNGGRRWRPVASLANADAMGWGFAQETVWVSGHPGLNRSEDGGRTFRRTNARLPNTDVHAFGAGGAQHLALDESRPGILYGASPAVGVFASADNGRSWQVRNNRIGQGFFGRIVIDPADSEHVFAADTANGPVESRDGARTWRRLGNLPGVAWLSASADLTQLVASGGSGGAIHSTDGGQTWTKLRTPNDALLVELEPDQPEVLYAAANVDGRARVWTSRDTGATWTRT